MKKLINIMFCCMSVFYLDAQNPVFPMFEDNPKWTVWGSLDPMHFPYENHTVEFEKDTLLCGKKYSRYLDNIHPDGDPAFTDVYYYRVENNNVYTRSDLSDCEDSDAMLYTFNANVGDTVLASEKEYYDKYFIVKAINDIELMAKVVREFYVDIMILYSDSSVTNIDLVYYEGIGSVSKHPLFGFEYGTGPHSNVQLSCMELDGELLYRNPTFSDCGVSGVSEIHQEISFHPNPFSDQIMVTNYTGKVRLMDINGKALLEKRISKNEPTIDVPNLENGVYFLRFENGEVQKIVKQ